VKPGPVYRAVFGVAGVLMVSRLLGFVREMVIADRFGTSSDYDLYLIAIMFSALAYGILNYAGYYLFVPFLTRKIQAADAKGRPPLDIWPLVNTCIVAAVGVIGLIVLAAPHLLRLWAAEYDASEFGRMVLFSRLTAVAVLLGVSEAFMRAVLNVKRIYTYPAAGFIVFNLFAIGSIALFSRQLGVGAIALGWIGGLLVQNIYLSLRLSGLRLFGAYNTRVYNEETKYLISTAGILIVIELINRSYFLIDRYFAAQFGEGIIAALNYCQVLIQLPDSIVGFAIGAVVFPIFSASAGDQKTGQFSSLYRKTITAALLIAVPIAAFLFVNAFDVVYLLFQRGEFDPHSTALTATVLRPYVPALVALFVVSTSIRACYSGGWVRAVAWFTLLLFVIKFVATALLARWFGYGGIAAATAVAQVGFATLLLVTVVYRSGQGDAIAFIWRLLRIVLAGVVAAALLWYVSGLWPESWQQADRLSAIFRLFISGAGLLLIYGVLVSVFGLGAQFRDLVTSRLRSERSGGKT